MADFSESSREAAVDLYDTKTEDSHPERNWESVLAGSTASTTGLNLETGLILEPGIILVS